MSLITTILAKKKNTVQLPVTLSGASFARQNTSLTNSLGPDGYTWAQAYPIVLDKYGKIIMYAQNTSGDHRFVYSNDNGSTWVDNTGITGNGGIGTSEGFILRSAIAYNEVDDVLWLLHVTANGGDGGAFLRRYTITRSSNNITGIVRDQSGSCVLEDDQNAKAEKPILLWLNDAEYGSHGALIAIWEITDANYGEIHGSMRTLSGTSADLTSSNWRTLAGGTTSDTTQTVTTKAAPISLLTPAYPSHVCPAIIRRSSGTHAKDLFLFWHQATTSGALHYRRLEWNAGTWTLGTATTISNTTRAGTNAGSPQQWEVLSKPTQSNTHVVIGYANWKDNTAGDTWSLAFINDAGEVSSVDVYSCGGRFTPNLYALAGDVAYDSASNRLVCAYIKSGGVGNNLGYIKLYNGTTSDGSEYQFFTAADIDIPLIYQDSRSGNTRINSKLFIAFRDTRNQTPPYWGWAGSINIG